VKVPATTNWRWWSCLPRWGRAGRARCRRGDATGADARGLLKAGHLRPDITADQAADILWAYSSPELYELLVIRRGWPAERHGQFVAEALIAALLPAQAT
jgi:hypothetical protein